MTKSYLQGGKLGDLIHSLCVCKYVYETTGNKADLYIANIGDDFEMGVEHTYNDLKPILEKQEWLNSFNIYKNEKIDYNLVNFRSSRFLFRTNWIEIFFKEFLNIDTPPKEYSWIDNIEKDESLKDTILISKSLIPIREDCKNIYLELIEKYENISFICYNKEQYESFDFKDKVNLILADSLYDFFKKINSCKLLISNQSGPAAWATAMNVPRVIELLPRLDRNHYINDINYYKNFNYF